MPSVLDLTELSSAPRARKAAGAIWNVTLRGGAATERTRRFGCDAEKGLAKGWRARSQAMGRPAATRPKPRRVKSDGTTDARLQRCRCAPRSPREAASTSRKPGRHRASRTRQPARAPRLARPFVL